MERLEEAACCAGPDKEIAQHYGFAAWHLVGLKHYCRDNQALLIVRASKAASRRFHNRSGYRPKPVDLKQKTLRGVAEGESLVYPNVNKFYSDYDIMSLWRFTGHDKDRPEDERAPVQTGTFEYAVPSLVRHPPEGPPSGAEWRGNTAYNALNCPVGYRESKTDEPLWYGWELDYGLDTLDELNEYVGDSTMFQHGANDQYRNWASNAMENEIRFDEKFLIFDYRMHITVCRNARALKACYDEYGLPWPPYEVDVG